VETEGVRTKGELKAIRCPTEPGGQKDEVKPEECSPELREGGRVTKENPGG